MTEKQNIIRTLTRYLQETTVRYLIHNNITIPDDEEEILFLLHRIENKYFKSWYNELINAYYGDFIKEFNNNRYTEWRRKTFRACSVFDIKDYLVSHANLIKEKQKKRIKKNEVLKKKKEEFMKWKEAEVNHLFCTTVFPGHLIGKQNFDEKVLCYDELEVNQEFIVSKASNCWYKVKNGEDTFILNTGIEVRHGCESVTFFHFNYAYGTKEQIKKWDKLYFENMSASELIERIINHKKANFLLYNSEVFKRAYDKIIDNYKKDNDYLESEIAAIQREENLYKRKPVG